LAGGGAIPWRTDFVPECLEAKIESVIEVTMNITADQVVAFDKALAAPRGPNAVWLPMPPNAAAMSPLLPLCSNTTMMMKKQTMMWMIVTSVIIMCDFDDQATAGRQARVNSWLQF